MKQYDNYKYSSVEWLGEIPEHWEVKRFKHITNIQKGKLPKKIVSINELNLPPYMSMEYLRGGEENQWVFDKDAKIIDENKTLLLWDGSNAGEFIKSRKGVISSTVAEIEFKNIEENFAWFYSKFLEIELRKKTIGMGIPHVNGAELKNFSVVIPPFQEQTAIANFLDDKTTKIDQAIAIKQQQIALLQERRQILIHKAVTRGLNENVKLKDSGVEWIGEIPEHWEVSKLSLMLTPYSIKNYPNETLLSITREQGVIERDMENLDSNHNFIPEDLSGYKLLKKGDFGMNKMKAWQGSYGVSKFTGIVSPAYFTFSLVDTISPDFFHLAIRSQIYVPFFGQASDGVRIGQWDLSKERMKNIPFVIPSLNEQAEILNYIDKTTNKTEIAISLKEQEIEKLKEYKMSLIDGVVTGKVRVI